MNAPMLDTPAQPLDHATCYAAFARKDKSMRGAFVGAVKTTGIYCRPGCPARMPKPENVSFFWTTAEARAAGYRACLRCRPDEAAPDDEAIERACRLIETAEETPPLIELARRAGLSPHHFHRLFKARLGVTPAAYAAEVRDRRAKAALTEGASITEAIYDSGYGAPSRFYDKAHARFGATPSQWRGKGAGLSIRAATAPCSLGWVLVAATERGVCAIELGDSGEALMERFTLRFPEAEVDPGDARLKGHLEAVVRLIDEPARPMDGLPLDIRGTAFQRRVWEALRRIPAGETWTYGRLAAEIGKPSAARAVGAACGANPICVIVPCHRVVGSDGSLTGYAYGTDRKRALLAREAKAR
ncbi:bifunctional DNA-binding transcriptional regulator/O6-methylguanine-DNA methyltransferase Ada [Brevundimonas sp. 2R-24]|uniref:Bifunctional DNA-binding transcriptional regulator/O6-methylguanine-DNA methyltransferase Ada n=1 Tax=Peiella sedimenti TaxID=3061083 RepID=A0ABT8SIX2_9CAUL|nr:bifunctional DNA-binding transcriptional regulator/O6-methylguanine-DNA methyltransferase Ada [Caulobacteraceae bacterium XZ-24]